MKQKILTGLIVASLGLTQYSTAQEWTVMSSETIESTVTVDESQDYISFYADNNLGGSDFFEFDLGRGIWTNVTADGDVLAGTIPQAIIDEYETENIPLPCFSSPVAVVGCAIGLTVGAAGVYFACERRANNNIRRMAAHCSQAGYNLRIRDISGCGNVESRCVLDPGFGDDDGGGVDG
ncbi:MAG: hypothetical protein WD397_07820 [Wenzhouxiangellaceae bacterium]